MDRDELDRWLREHDYALVTREQAARLEGALGLPGVVPWDEHRRALAKADAELAELQARVAQLETILLALIDLLGGARWDEVGLDVVKLLDEARALLDGDATPAP